jgi:transposase
VDIIRKADTMSTMVEAAPTLKRRRAKRQFSDEFRAGAVRLVMEEHRGIAQVARELDLTESALRLWVNRARADRRTGRPGVLTTAEREELSRLRKENRELRMERDILKKAAAFFAKSHL